MLSVLLMRYLDGLFWNGMIISYISQRIGSKIICIHAFFPCTVVIDKAMVSISPNIQYIHLERALNRYTRFSIYYHIYWRFESRRRA